MAHNEPTLTLMDDARRRMQAALLWSSENAFLSQPLVQDVLLELGVANPAVLLDDLMNVVRRRLVEPAEVTRGDLHD